MSLRHQRSNLTNEKRGGLLHTLQYNFYVRVAWICIALVALMLVTIGTYQGTESLIYLLTHTLVGGN